MNDAARDQHEVSSPIIPPSGTSKYSGQSSADQRLEVRAVSLALAVGVFLLLVKFLAYFLTHSAAIFSDAVENIVNVLASGFALYSINLAHRPADKEHPYGHGKIEFFSAGLEGAMILLASVLIIGKAALSFFNSQTPSVKSLDLGLLLMAFALVVNGAVGFYLWTSGRKRNSITLEADGIHLMSDALDSMIVLAALVLIRATGWQWLDPVAAIGIAIYISWLGIKLIQRSSAGLMDQQDVGDEKLISGIIDSHVGPEGKEPRICSFHKLRHRHAGRYHWVDFHIVVPAWWDIDQAHRVASTIEYEIELAIKEGNATAHVEPCITAGCPTCEASRAAVS
jgi:cation diffusion facilitator family transporter